TRSKRDWSSDVCSSDLNLSAQYSSPMLVLVAGATGMRFAELLGLTWEDIDFEDQIVTINKTWNYKLNEWGKTKNETSNRKISIRSEERRVGKDNRNRK